MEHDCSVFPHGSISAWTQPVCHTTLTDSQAGPTHLCGGGELAGWETASQTSQTRSVAFNKAHTFETRRLVREKTAQEREGIKRERDGAARGEESRLWRATGEMAAVGALEIAWLITAAARPCVVMAGSERALGWDSDSQRVKDRHVFVNHQRNTSKAGMLVLPFQKRHPALQRGGPENC